MPSSTNIQYYISCIIHTIFLIFIALHTVLIAAVSERISAINIRHYAFSNIHRITCPCHIKHIAYIISSSIALQYNTPYNIHTIFLIHMALYTMLITALCKIITAILGSTFKHLFTIRYSIQFAYNILIHIALYIMLITAVSKRNTKINIIGPIVGGASS